MILIDGKKCNIECKVAYKNNKLIGFIKSQKKISSNEILNKIKPFLEIYEKPNQYIFLKNFFYTSSGKIDTPKMIKKYIE